MTPPISEGRSAGGGARELRVEMEPLDDGRLCVRVWGELDLATTAELEDSLAEAFSTARGVVLDLAGLSFMDSTGLAAIISAVNRADLSGASFEIAQPLPAQPQRLLELTGVIARLSFTDSPSRA